MSKQRQNLVQHYRDKSIPTRRALRDKDNNKGYEKQVRFAMRVTATEAAKGEDHDR